MPNFTELSGWDGDRKSKKSKGFPKPNRETDRTETEPVAENDRGKISGIASTTGHLASAPESRPLRISAPRMVMVMPRPGFRERVPLRPTLERFGSDFPPDQWLGKTASGSSGASVEIAPFFFRGRFGVGGGC